MKEESLKPYNGYLKTLMKGFDKCLFIHLSRDENQMAVTLATLSSMWDRPTGTMMKPLVIMKTRAPCYGGESVMSTQNRLEVHRRKKVSRGSKFEREICSLCSST